MIKFLPYGRQFIDETDISSVIDVLKSDYITQGPRINEFEEALAEYCDSRYAVCFNSGTSALHAAYHALGIGEGDEVITSPNTFIATSNAALYLDAVPVFTDVEKCTGNMDVSLVEEKITSKTKLIVPVHYSGNPVDLKALSEIAVDHNIRIVEDAAHALGASYEGKPVGNSNYSELSVFSFHPVKHITTGEGGMVLTDNKDYYDKMVMFRSHGVTKDDFTGESDGDWYYEMQFLGYNYRMTDIQAALGISQLLKLPEFVRRRQCIAETYDKAFKDNQYFKTIPKGGEGVSSYHLYPILINDEYRDKKREIFSKLRLEGLGVQVHYIPVYLQPYYQRLGYQRGSCPVAEDFYKCEISIPMYPSLSDSDVRLCD